MLPGAVLDTHLLKPGKEFLYGVSRMLTLPAADKWLVCKVSLTLPVVEAGLRLLGLRTVTRLLASRAPATESVISTSEVERQARIVSMVVRRHPFAGKCLSRSLTLWWSLSRIGIKSDVKLGVRKDGDQLRG